MGPIKDGGCTAKMKETYLFDTTMASSSANIVETELAQVDLGQGFRRSDLAGLRRKYPIHLDGLAKVDVGGEDADFLGLTLEGERERGVARRGDVGLVDVKHGGVESMVCDGVEDGKQSDGEGDEKDTGSDEETAVAEFSREVLFLVRAAASANETDGLTGLVEASAGGSVRGDALGSRASTEVLPGAVAVVGHDERGN